MNHFEIRDECGNFQAEGTRDSVREPWTLRYEEGEERFAGTEKQARARVSEHLKEPRED